MIAAVIGSRKIECRVDAFIPEGTEEIVTGGARGVDQAAEEYALRHGIACTVIRPDYARFGRRAPIIRNEEIVDRADIVIAVWDGRSRGTQHTLQYAYRRHKDVRVYRLPPDEQFT